MTHRTHMPIKQARRGLWVAGVMAALCLAASFGISQAQKGPRVITVGPEFQITDLSQAAAIAQDGDQIFIAPGNYAQCATWTASNITIKSLDRGRVRLHDTLCQGPGEQEAIFIITGDDVEIEGITFEGANLRPKVAAPEPDPDALPPPGNPADDAAEATRPPDRPLVSGLVFLGRNLTLRNCRFNDNEQGLAVANAPQGRVLVEDAIFERNGAITPTLGQALATGELERLTISRSTFRSHLGGYHIATAARQATIFSTVISDRRDGIAAGLLHFPQGGIIDLYDNQFFKGPKTPAELSAIRIGPASDARDFDVTIRNNVFVNAADRSAYFIANGAEQPIKIGENRLTGTSNTVSGAFEVLPAPDFPSASPAARYDGNR